MRVSSAEAHGKVDGVGLRDALVGGKPRLARRGSDPRVGRRLGHALADEAVSRGGSTRLFDAFGGRPPCHAV
jgi:hypothetical protein